MNWQPPAGSSAAVDEIGGSAAVDEIGGSAAVDEIGGSWNRSSGVLGR
jgi:hypothetical protein